MPLQNCQIKQSPEPVTIRGFVDEAIGNSPRRLREQPQSDSGLQLGEGLNLGGETALVACSGVAVEHTLAGHLVDRGFGSLEGFLGSSLVAGGDELCAPS